MRELKFRHYDTRHNEMRYSDKHDGEFYINLKGILYMYALPKSETGLETKYYKSYDVEQYTGLKDKNGLEIYEGDIVKTRTLSAELNELGFENYEVSFFNGAYCLFRNKQPARQWKDGTHDWYSLENTESFEIEVIGNIHQNPELLK